ncbi:MAG: hypothetical protein V1944_02295 [Candidatus Aenigmatarchaeota archaeon]
MWFLVLVPIIIVGVVIAIFAVPKTPDYVPPTTTTTTTKTTTRTTTRTTQTITTTTTASDFTPCNLFKAVCKSQCDPIDDLLDAPCYSTTLVCCRPRIISTTTTTTTTSTPNYPQT